jgi:hypothetical protein
VFPKVCENGDAYLEELECTGASRCWAQRGGNCLHGAAGTAMRPASDSDTSGRLVELGVDAICSQRYPSDEFSPRRAAASRTDAPARTSSTNCFRSSAVNRLRMTLFCQRSYAAPRWGPRSGYEPHRLRVLRWKRREPVRLPRAEECKRRTWRSRRRRISI